MDTTILFILGSVVLVSLISLVGVFTLSLRVEAMHKFIFFIVSVSAGALFGDALIHLLPEAIEETGDATYVALLAMAGILSFFVLEKFLRWKHTHDTLDHDADTFPEMHEGATPHAHGEHVQPLGYLILTSDAVHNAIDGVIIAASYFVSIEVGIATTIAVILHEIPQEISHFGLLLHSGFSRGRALLMNFLSAIPAVLGALLVVFVGGEFEGAIAPITAFAAGTFLYIAGSDLIPEIHKTSDPRRSVVQFVALVIGIGIMLALLLLE